MKYKENDEIWIKARVESINSGTDRFLPYHVSIEANGKNSDGFLTYINISDKCETKPVEDICSCLHEEYGKQVCYGTKEREECVCGGDKSKCNFYADVRKKESEKNSTVTAQEYRTALREFYELNYCDILKMFDIPEYGSVIDKETAIVEIIHGYDPEDVVGALKDYKDEYVINVGDVIKLLNKNKDYLVTKIFNCIVYMIALDGETKEETIGNIEKSGFEKVSKNMTIQEFFNKEE